MTVESTYEKVAADTATSPGIGQATAVELARRGYQVAIHYFRNEQGARDTYEKIRTLGAGHARVYSCDVSDHAQAGQMAGDVLADFGRIDLLVNNAGPLVERRLFAGMDRDLWRRVMALNLDSVFDCCKFALQAMLPNKKGVIVNISSVLGLVGGDDDFATHAYATSKGAVISLTRSIASYYAPRSIRANVICPALIATPMSQRVQESDHIRSRLAQLQPLTGDFGSPEASPKAKRNLVTRIL